jgi:nicotinate-nucleotide adenylyltransferase
MKAGIYGGTFDPIHNGHLILAREAVEKLHLDHIVFIPNMISPHRARHKPASDALRYAMIEAAIAGEPHFRADDVEMRRGGVSYTVETILALKEKYGQGAEFYYLIGQDNVDELHTWHRIDDLKLLVTFVVFPRSNRDTQHLLVKLDRRIDISATEIRARVAKGLSIRYLVPDAVEKIIADNQLYKESPHQI